MKRFANVLLSIILFDV